LLPLLPTNKAENPTAYKVVAAALRTIQPIVQHSIGAFVRDVLVNPQANFEVVSSDLSDEIYALIFELHLVAPSLLFGVIPELTALLKVEDDGVRLKIVKLFCRLYISELFDYVTQFPKDFREFATRVNDRNAHIRTETVETIITILSVKPQTKSVLEGKIL
jgi:hypothetical protein